MNFFFKWLNPAYSVKRIFAITIGLILFSFSSHAQKTNIISGKITGRIVDSLSRQPIEYATISLLTQQGKKIVNGTTADNNGYFKLTNIPEGIYKIRIEFIGYKRGERNNIILNQKNPNIDLGDIDLSINPITMKSVTISIDKNLIENKIDKMVYNTDKDITSQSGVASDVLKKVPQVSVDVDGNVELQGNSNILFLIDGKPSVMYGSNITDVLQSIPASQIQSIELITSPGAKYDASGTGGIINIILKKSTVRGFNGNISLSGGTRLENGSVNLNFRKSKFGINAFFSGNAQLLSVTKNNMDRKSFDTTSTSTLLQQGTSNFNRDGYQSGIGFDWDLTPKDNINATFGNDYIENNNMGNANRQTLVQDTSGMKLSDINDLMNTSNKFQENTYNWSLNYKRKFKKKDQKLEILINSSNGNLYSYYEQTQRNRLPDTIVNSSKGKNTGISNQTNFEANYLQPIGKDASFETGVKTIIGHINSVSDVYLLSPLSGNFDYSTPQSSSVDYKRNIYAGYLSVTFKLFKFMDVKAGLRDEYTEANAVYSNVGKVNLNPYNTIVPSVVILHTFKKKQSLKISYTHRIRRPEYLDLNPFLNESDPKNITTGNPNLRPEIGDKIELSFNQTFKSGATINPTIFYRGKMDDIQPYMYYYPTYKIGDSNYTNVSISKPENIGREDNFGLSLFASIPITNKINLRANISCFQRYIYTAMSSGGNMQGFNYRTNINATYQLSKTLIIELLGNFNSPRINAQGKMPSFTTYNFALRKQLFNKKGSIAITATNFFNKYVDQKTELTGANFTISNSRQLPYRSFGFNFTYKFGKMEFRNDREDINLTNPPTD